MKERGRERERKGKRETNRDMERESNAKPYMYFTFSWIQSLRGGKSKGFKKVL